MPVIVVLCKDVEVCHGRGRMVRGGQREMLDNLLDARDFVKYDFVK